MISIPDSLVRQLRRAGLGAFLVGLAPAGVAPCLAQAPIIQLGPPGEPARQLTAAEAVEIADTSYSPDDALFMQDMIPHHHQAIEMAELVADRTNRPELVDVSGRINSSQRDEIDFMQQWLRDRGERVRTPPRTMRCTLTTRWPAWPRRNKWPNSANRKARTSTGCFWS